MDPNFIKTLDYFTVPNNQTVNPVDRAANLARPPPGQQPGLWNPSALGSEVGASLSSSTPQSAGSFEQFQSTSSAPSNISFSPPQRQRSLFTQGPRTILPTRTPRPKERHERKRSKLSTDATPFDSVDYWLQFDNEDGAQEESGGNPSHLKAESQGMMKSSAAPSMDRNTGRPQGGPQAARQEDAIDDSALDNALSDEEENYSSINLAEQLSKIDSAAPSEVPQREGLYSTPLSWERPQPGLRMDSIMSTQSQATLDQEEQRRLIAIAMNPGSSMGGLGSTIVNQYGSGLGGSSMSSGLGSGMGSGLGTGSHGFGGGMSSGFGAGLGTTSLSQVMNTPSHLSYSPSVHRPQPQRQDSMASEKGKEKAGKAGDRTAHNDIERKYRTNLKDKISELRDAVPALRTIPENAVDDGDEDGQPSRGPKVSKGTVLTKATEYIHYLEKKNKMILQQHQELSRRLQAFEQLLNATARPTYQMPNYSRTIFDPRAFC